MDDREPDYSPFAPEPPRPPTSPRLEVWRLRKAGREVTCEIRNDTAKGAGWDALLLEKGDLGFSKRCQSYEQAHFTANSWRQDYLRAGYDA